MLINPAVLAGAIIIFCLAAWRPKIGVYLTAASLPLIGRDFYIHGLIIPAADLVAILSLLGFFTNLTFTALFRPQEKIKLIWPLFFPFALFFAANLFSIAFNSNPTASLYYFLRWPLFLYFAYIFVPANVIKNKKDLKQTVIIVFLSAVAVLVSGYLSLWGQDWQNSFFRLKSIYFLKSYPFGENHNLIAEFLNVGAFFVLVIREMIKDKRWQRAADLLFLLSALAIILTFSRTGWIILFLQSIIYIYYHLKHNPKEKMAVALFALMLTALISPLLWKMGEVQARNVSSTENRILLTEIALEAFQEKPLFGHGSGRFVGLVEDNIRFTAKYGSPVDSHGIIQKLLAENGLFGLATWLFLLFCIVNLSIRAIRCFYPRVRWILPFALAALGGIFFQFFNTSYYKGRVWFPIILFFLAFHFSKQQYNKILSKKYAGKN